MVGVCVLLLFLRLFFVFFLGLCVLACYTDIRFFERRVLPMAEIFVGAVVAVSLIVLTVVVAQQLVSSGGRVQ